MIPLFFVKAFKFVMNCKNYTQSLAIGQINRYTILA